MTFWLKLWLTEIWMWKEEMLQKRSLEKHTYINTTNEEILAVQKAEMTVNYRKKRKAGQKTEHGDNKYLISS